MFAILLGLCGFATIEPEVADAVEAAVRIGAIGCVLWVIWRLMQYD